MAEPTLKKSPTPRSILADILVGGGFGLSLVTLGDVLTPGLKTGPMLYFAGSLTLVVIGSLLQVRKPALSVLSRLIAALGFMGMAHMLIGSQYHANDPEYEVVWNAHEIKAALETANKAGAKPLSVDELIKGKFLVVRGNTLSGSFFEPEAYRWTWEFSERGRFEGSIGVEGHQKRPAPAYLISYDYFRPAGELTIFGQWPGQQAKLPESFKPVGPER
ncbi:MAG: hypothetical protein IT462_16070 [Planctomycetes bacterium]|nr:hypothetical protein [Planctomycetota bacterium]